MTQRRSSSDTRESLLQVAQGAGLRTRLIITLSLILFVRLGVRLPVPGIDRAAFAQALQGSPVTGIFNLLSGGGLLALGVFALGILPYINASIIIQLLSAAVPALERLQKNEGEAGRRQISQVTRYIACASAFANSLGVAVWVRPFLQQSGLLHEAEIVVALTSGAMFVMWISELITERGIGNGASLLIFVNIVSALPSTVGNTLDFAQSGGQQAIVRVFILVSVFLLMIVGIVFVQEATRRIPIISARRQVGKRVYRERSSYLPLKLNQGGVLPIIFASTVLALPASLTQFLSSASSTPDEGGISSIAYNFALRLSSFISPGGPTPFIYILAYLALILFFSFFYASLVVNPDDISRNLKKMGSSVPGIRPGQVTSAYISGIIDRLTLLGAIFLGLVAIVPTVVEGLTGVTTFQGFGATSLLILVGVAIETARQVQSNLISQRYEGMVKK